MAALIFVWLFLSLFWGSLCKVLAGNRGLDERRSYWLGFLLWLIGLIIVLASHPEPAPTTSQPARTNLPPLTPALGPTVAEEISTLAALRNSGDISWEEYETLKAKLL